MPNWYTLFQAEQSTFQALKYAPKAEWITPQLAEELHKNKRLHQNHDQEAFMHHRQLKNVARKLKRQWIRTQLTVAKNIGKAFLVHHTQA